MGSCRSAASDLELAAGPEAPAAEGEPQDSAHIMDLYAYLSARAAGTQGAGRPPQ